MATMLVEGVSTISHVAMRRVKSVRLTDEIVALIQTSKFI